MSIFTKENYNSKNGMTTSIWGPPTWFTLHITSFNYPTKPTADDKKNYKNWLLAYQYTLPCVYCRQNFKNNIKYAGFNDKVFTNRDTFSRFIYKLHNCVNMMLGKSVNLTYEEVRDRYENFRSRCSEKERRQEMKKKEKTDPKEKKCEGMLYSTKSRSTIRIVPKESKVPGFKIDKKCKIKKSKKK